MKPSFSFWKSNHDKDKLDILSIDPYGVLWLKIKSIARKELMAQYIKYIGISLTSKKIHNQFEELYTHHIDDISTWTQRLNTFIVLKNKEQFADIDIEKLVSELYKLRNFDWGGDYKNALDKYLVDRYIKVHQSYDDLVSTFDTHIHRAVQGYVCSWYNHRSSILIEHIFKSHPVVLPTVGQIKKVDFFLGDMPFDLKVTYLPNNYIKSRRKLLGLPPELSQLKKQAIKLSITFDKNKRDDDIYYEIVEKMNNRGDHECLTSLADIKKVRLQILQEVIENPKLLIQNLYEEQGEMRFDSSNRLFLILVDSNDFDNSWKLKRNLEALRPSINAYLDTYLDKSIDDLKIEFDYTKKGPTTHYTAYSDCIFVVR